MQVPQTKKTLKNVINQKVKILGLDTLRFSEKIDTSYEHARRIVNGLTIPGPELRSKIAEVLSIHISELDALASDAKRDGIATKAKIADDPEYKQLERYWQRLTLARKRDIIDIARLWSRDQETEKEQGEAR